MTAYKLLTLANRLLRQHILCDWCLGRQFAFLGYGLSNKTRGAALKVQLLMTAADSYQKDRKRGTTLLRRLAEYGKFEPAKKFLKKEGITDPVPDKPCEICQDVMDQLSRAADAAIQSLQT